MTRQTILGAAVLGLALACPPCPAAPGRAAAKAAVAASPPVIEAENVSYSYDTDDITGHGSARWKDGERLLTADQLVYEKKDDRLVAQGHVAFTFGAERMLADRLEYRRAGGSFVAKNVRFGRYPIYIEGETAEGTKDDIVVHHATVSYLDPGPWRPSIKADIITYSPGRYVRIIRSFVGVHDAEFLPIPRYGITLDEAPVSSWFSLAAGYRSSLGGTADLGLRVPVLDGAKAGGDLGYYTKRGLMAGPSAAYSDPDGSGDWLGSLTSGFISDHGSRLTDVLGAPIPENRAFVEWNHRQQLADGLTLNGNIDWWKDSDVIRDFRPNEFPNVQNPDSYLEAVYAGQNTFASAFARFQPNSWEAVQERLPELRFDLMPTNIGGGFYERFDASAVSLFERPPGGGAELASDRLDAFYGISRPISPVDWATITPVAGGRITDYVDTKGAAVGGGYLRALGEIGFDAVARASGTFSYQNPVWDINGLRHLLTPTLSYRYIPEADAGQAKIPAIDTRTFSTYLPPLELGDVPWIDDLQPVNTLRIGLGNILQTRDSAYGSRDLVRFTIADDLNFTRTAQEPDFSDLHAELAVMPAAWLRIDSAEIVSSQTGALREFDSGLTLRDVDAWSLRLASDFLTHEDNDYLLDAETRLNEELRAVLIVEYGAREHRVNLAEVGLTQSLANTWNIRYLLTLNGGPNREGRLGFQVEIDAIRF